MSKQKIYDLVVVGGGPGGYTAAFRGADLGLDVCLIEQHSRLGGVCLNVGCIPSKTLLHSAALIEEAREASEFGIDFQEPSVDINQLRLKKETVIKKLTDGLDKLAKARKITRLFGYGTFIDSQSVKVVGIEGDSIVYFNNAIIATGSRPFTLPDLPQDSRIWTSTKALELADIPQRLLVIGGGIIGLEMAQVYSALGSDITIVEMQDHLIPPADKDMIQTLSQKLKKRYSIHTRSKVVDISASEHSLQVTMESSKGRNTKEFDAVLVAIGRKPNSDNIGLENLNIMVNQRGFIEVDDRQQTSSGHIFAIGDVVGEPMLAHKASHQAKVAAEVIAGHNSSFSPLTIPSVAYTNPEVAWAGCTEQEAKAQGLAYEKGKFLWGASGRALTAGTDSGASKVLFSKETGKILGAAISGQNAGELIHEAVLAIQMGATAADIASTVHAHPTLAETFAFACEIVDGSITDGLLFKKK